MLQYLRVKCIQVKIKCTLALRKLFKKKINKLTDAEILLDLLHPTMFNTFYSSENINSYVVSRFINMEDINKQLGVIFSNIQFKRNLSITVTRHETDIIITCSEFFLGNKKEYVNITNSLSVFKEQLSKVIEFLKITKEEDIGFDGLNHRIIISILPFFIETLESLVLLQLD